MTTDPIIVSADATVAEGLALIRRHELAPALGAAVCVTLPPYEPPTGRFLGIVHFQRMLRYPPHERLGTLLDTQTEPVRADTSAAEVSRILASYNLVQVPVVDENHRLVGVVTVDDVLDRLLPDDWRTGDAATPQPPLRRPSTRHGRHRDPAAEDLPWPRRVAASSGGRSTRSRSRRASRRGRRRPHEPRRLRPVLRGFARGDGHVRVPDRPDRLRASPGWPGTRSRRSRAVRPGQQRLRGDDADPVAAGVLRRAPHPARAEPAGRPRPRAGGAGPAAGAAEPRRHRVPRPRDRRAAAARARHGVEGLRPRRSCAGCSRSSTSARRTGRRARRPAHDGPGGRGPRVGRPGAAIRRSAARSPSSTWSTASRSTAAPRGSRSASPSSAAPPPTGSRRRRGPRPLAVPGRRPGRARPRRDGARAPGGARRAAARRAREPVRSGLADPRDRGDLRQGRRRQVDGHREPRRRARRRRPLGRGRRRRRARLLDPRAARHRARRGARRASTASSCRRSRTA